jgi:hypothetical protein
MREERGTFWGQRCEGYGERRPMLGLFQAALRIRLETLGPLSRFLDQHGSIRLFDGAKDGIPNLVVDILDDVVLTSLPPELRQNSSVQQSIEETASAALDRRVKGLSDSCVGGSDGSHTLPSVLRVPEAGGNIIHRIIPAIPFPNTHFLAEGNMGLRSIRQWIYETSESNMSVLSIGVSPHQGLLTAAVCKGVADATHLFPSSLSSPVPPDQLELWNVTCNQAGWSGADGTFEWHRLELLPLFWVKDRSQIPLNMRRKFEKWQLPTLQAKDPRTPHWKRSKIRTAVRAARNADLEEQKFISFKESTADIYERLAKTTWHRALLHLGQARSFKHRRFGDVTWKALLPLVMGAVSRDVVLVVPRDEFPSSASLDDVLEIVQLHLFQHGWVCDITPHICQDDVQANLLSLVILKQST